LPPSGLPSALKPLVTYSVCVAGSTAMKPGPLPTGAEPTSADPDPNGPVDALKLDNLT